ncbi:MAG: hypothetical protein AAB421_02885 [Patescibacteria group bacterium]
METKIERGTHVSVVEFSEGQKYTVKKLRHDFSESQALLKLAEAKIAGKSPPVEIDVRNESR